MVGFSSYGTGTAPAAFNLTLFLGLPDGCLSSRSVELNRRVIVIVERHWRIEIGPNVKGRIGCEVQ